VNAVLADELERAGADGRHQYDPLCVARPSANQGRVGGLVQILEPSLETIELPGDTKLGIQRIRIDAGLARLANELRRRRDVLKFRQLARQLLQLLVPHAQLGRLRRLGRWFALGGRLVFVSARRRVNREQHGAQDYRFAQHRFESRPVVSVDPNVLVS